VILLDASRAIATLDLSTADVALLIRGEALRVAGRLGSLTFADNSNAQFKHPALKEILSIEGSNFADFSYETFDPAEETFPGVNSKVVLHAGSVKLNFLEQPLHDLFEFLLKLAKLKGLYDAAAEVAVQSASGIQRMQFDISVKTPIVVFPREPSTTEDALVLKLGEIIAKNQYQGDECKTQASLRGIRLTSHTYPDGQLNRLKIIDDVEITANVIQTSNIDHVARPTFPETQVCGIIPAVANIHLSKYPRFPSTSPTSNYR
jgi:vacuolar protein sorting-associated protein 13A/C